MRASVDTVSTMLGRSLNGVARTRSSQGSKLRPQRRLHSNGLRTFLNSQCSSPLVRQRLVRLPSDLDGDTARWPEHVPVQEPMVGEQEHARTRGIE